MPHVLAASYYSLNNDLSATLVLSNQGPHSMNIAVTLFNLIGDRLVVPPITLEGNTVRGFDLSEWTGSSSTFREGSLQVSYNGHDMELGGLVKLVDANRSLIFDEELNEPMMFASSRLEGIWWLPSHKTQMLLAVSNTTDAPLSVNINVDGVSPKQKESKVLTLGSHETRVMRVQDFAENGRGTLSKIGGISINHSGSPGALLARALIAEPETGYSSVVEFSDPQTAKSSRLDGAGLRIGKIAGEQLTQAAVARNVGDSSSVITGRIAYAMSDGSTNEVSLPQVHLAAGEVREVNLAEAIKASGLRSVAAAGLQFEYSSQPGSVIMSARSVSESGNQVFRVPLVDAKAQENSTGKYPWMIQDSASTFVYLKNTTDHPQKYQLQVNYEGGAYAPGIKTIAAGQTIAFDIRKLRDQHVPDESGHTIPPNATGGQVYWSVDGREDLTMIGRAEQVDVVRGLSLTSSCGACCPASFDNGWVTPGSFSGVSGDTSQFVAMQQKHDCLGNLLNPTIISYPTWSSSDTTIATVNSSGLATAQGGGTAYISASWDITYIYYYQNGCFFDPDNCVGGHCYHTYDTETAYAAFNVRPKINSITPGRGLVGNTIAVSIDGQGFGVFPTVNAGNGITSTVNFANSTSFHIDASFAIASNASGGNQSVSVTVGGQTSNSMNFFVQIPTALGRFDFPPGAPGGYGPLTLTSNTNNEVRDVNGNVIPGFTNQCGVYRNLVYELKDQEGQSITQPFDFTETFSNYTGVSTLPKPLSGHSSVGLVQDTQYFGKTLPDCLGPNDNESFDQRFIVTVGGTQFSLSTVVHIARGRASGNWFVDVTTTTP